MSNDRYEVKEVLRDGRGARTLLAADRFSGEPCVIKELSVSSTVRERLEGEAEFLRKAQSPLLASILQVEIHEKRLRIIRPFIAGVPLSTRLQGGPLPLSETISIGRGVLAALRVVHAHDRFHLNLKPGNVIICKSPDARQIVLTDPGLTYTPGEAGEETPLETAWYISPEQAGLLARDISAGADLYVFGVLFYQCLSGQLPFQGKTLGEILRKHLSEPPPRLRSFLPATPRALDEWLQRLLRKDPRDRYQLAQAAEADLAEIESALERGNANPVVAIGSRDRRRTLTDPSFVGRDREFDALDAALAQAVKGRGGLTLLEGKSGEGKTAFQNEFAQRCAQEGIRVFRGTGVDQIASRPFMLLEELSAELITAAKSDPTFCINLRTRLGGLRDTILSLLPALKEVLGPESSEILGPEQHVEARSLTALASFLGALGSPDRPVALLLDDCQWGDELTLKALRYWQHQNSHGEAQDRYILIIVSFRSEEAPADHLLRTIRPSSHILLKPFGPQETRALAGSMAGSLPEEAMEVVTRLAQGSPFLTIAVLRGLVEAGALAAGPLGWLIDREGFQEIQSSARAADFLTRRVNRLPPETRRFLSAGAVLGKRFDTELALTLVGQTAEKGSRMIKEAEQRQIVWTEAGGKACAFFHDKLREALLLQLSKEEQRRLHSEAALLIERLSRDRSFELSYHFGAAEEWEQAFPYALLAAEEARRQHALEVAEQHYRIAERGLERQERITRNRVVEGLADVLMLRGRYDESIDYFETIRSWTESAVERAKIDGKLGELFFKKGNTAAAGEALQRALGLLGQKIPNRFPALIGLCLWEMFVQTLHTLFPRFFLARRPLKGAEQELLRIHLFSRLAYAWWFERGAVPTLWAHLREMNLAEQYPPTPELGQAYSNHAPAATIIGYFSRGERYAKKSLAVRRQLGDPWGEGQTLSFYGVVLYAGSKFSQTLEICQEAFRLLDRTGDRWEAHISLFHVAASLYRMGDLRGAEQSCRRIYQLGREVGETHASGLSIGIWAMASGGAVPQSVIDDLTQRAEGDPHTLQGLKMAEGICLLHQGELDRAVSAFQEARRIIKEADIQNEYVVPLPVWLATALRLQWERTPAYDHRRRRALLRSAHQTLRQGLRLARKFQNSLPHALREEALLAATRGRERTARRRFDESLAVADRQGARYEHAQTLVARGEVGRALGWITAETGLADAKRGLLSMTEHLNRENPKEEPNKENRSPQGLQTTTLSLVDRFSTLQEVGREIASALSREAVFAAVRRAALALLRGESCVIHDVPGAPEGEQTENGRPENLLASAREDALCRTLIERAHQEGRPATHADDPLKACPEGIVRTDVRSGLCALIVVHGRVTACFFVTHRQISGLFGEDEIRLAEFLAILAGAALENAEGFAKIEAFSRELEERVAERTAELIQANRELEAFVYTASHDLKAPVVSLNGMASMLMEDYGRSLDERGRRYIERILWNAGFMERLIADLLAFARLGKKEGRAEALASEEVVREILVQCEQAIQRRGAAVTVRSPLPNVTFDPTHFKQIFLNLIGNAVKFLGDQPEPHVEIGGEENAEWIEFYVRDNGIGIDPEHQEKVFAIFQRLKEIDVEGTGIGLAIVKKIIDFAGGKIWIESKKGEGATFRFRIPRM